MHNYNIIYYNLINIIAITIIKFSDLVADNYFLNLYDFIGLDK